MIKESMDDYLSSRALSASDIKLFLNKSPYHFANRHLLPKKESAALSLGTAAHYAILEPEHYEQNKAIEPGLRRNTNAYKDWLKEQSPSAIIVPADFDLMVKRIKANLELSQLAKLLTKGEPELSFYATIDGLDLRCRPDWISIERKLVVDLKTSRDLRWFSSDARNYGYHFSVPHYLRIIAQQTSTAVEDWQYIFLAVETEMPYDCNWYTLSQDSLETATVIYDKALADIKHCMDSDSWPGYCQDQPTEI